MTKLMEEAVAVMSELPQETQDDLARFVLAIAANSRTPLTTDEAATHAEADAEIGRGERVAPEAIQAFWRAHGP
jgi:hypothetical protein